MNFKSPSSLRVSLTLLIFIAIVMTLSGSGLLSSMGALSSAQTESGNPGFQEDIIASGFVVSDVLVSEPITGTTTASFTVSLTSALPQTATVSYATANSTAIAPGDFVAVAATQLTFTAGQTSKTVSVTINSDATFEPLESFFVNLSSATGAAIVDSQGVGRIKQAVVDGDIGYENGAIIKVNPDGGSTLFLANGSNLSWSPDGTKFLFASSFPRHVIVANANGLNQTDLTPATSDNYNPVWSPDGSKIAFVSTRNGNEEIYTMNANGTSQTRLTSNGGSDYNPKWSPDGSKIAFVSAERIFVMNTNGTSQTNLSGTNPFEVEPSWSPDGQKLVFSSSVTGVLQLYAINVDGSGRTQLTNQSFNSCRKAVWSPNGNKIAFLNEGDDRGYFVMNTNGTGLTRINSTDLNTFNGSVEWSPTGTRLTFVANFVTGTDSSPHLFVVNPDGTNQNKITSFFENQPEWQPIPAIGPLLSINNTSVVEGNSGTVLATFTVTLSQASAQTVTANFITVDQSASLDNDYVGRSDIVTFTPGQVSRSISITINSDTVQEEDETFFLELTSATNAQFLDRIGIGTITTDDRPANDAFANAQLITGAPGNVTGNNVGATREINEPVSEGTASIWYRWQAPSTGAFTFRVQPFSGFESCTADQSLDIYTGTALNNLTPRAANGSAQLAGFDAVAGTQYFIRIDKAKHPMVLFWSNAHKVTGTVRNINGREIGGGVSIEFTSFCNGGMGNYSTPYTFYFPVGQSIVVRAALAINNPTIEFRTSGVQDFNIFSPVFPITGRLRNLPANASGITVSKNTSTPCTVQPALTDGSIPFDCGNGSYQGDYKIKATLAGYDFRPISGACSDDPSAYCILGLPGAVSTTMDVLPSLSVNDRTKVEGNSGTTTFDFTVSMPASTQQVTVSVSTVDGSATTANNDYVAISPTLLTFLAGQTSKTVNVTVNGDSAFEPNETFVLRLDNETNAAVAKREGTGTIQNDDAAPVAPTAVSTAATAVTATSATLNGTVNPNGVPTNAFFAWGTSAGSLTNVTANQSIGSGNTAQAISATITNLTPGTTYFYRMAGTSTAGTGQGTVLSFQTHIQATVQTNPAGLSVSIDGGPPVINPAPVQWVPGSQHTIATTSPQAGAAETRYLFNNWSDGGALSHTVTAPTTSTIYTANFTTQFQLTMSAGSGGTAQPGSGFLNSGQSVLITATPNNGFSFSGWTGTGTGSFTGSTNPVSITMNGPITQTASFVPANTLQFTSANVSANEGAIKIDVTVSRGNAAGTASVNYATSDTSGANNCNVTNGAASSRCDYLITLGTLQFAVGEASKTISIPLVNDVYVEGNETFTVTLSNPVGATLGTPASAILTIVDNDSTPGASNPIDSASFFVRQHYIDFLNREPDAGGLSFWTNEITSCGTDAQCIEVKRINVSAAFFLSIEFQETGYLVYRVYKSGLGNLPGAPVSVRFIDFIKDTQQIGKGVQVGIGDWNAQLESNKQAYALAFVQRADFLASFPDTMTADQFVAKLDTNAGGVLSPSEKTNLSALLGATPSDLTKRATVLRAVADDDDLRSAEFNKAFVLMQYFGYMRRSPNDAPDSDFLGFNFWLGKLESFGGNFINAEMVKAFILSGEYRKRFAP